MGSAGGNPAATGAGGGYSRWQNLALTRWREDATCDNWGSFCYVRDVANRKLWSVAYQPTLERPDTSEVILSEGRVVLRRRDHGIDLHTEIAVAAVIGSVFYGLIALAERAVTFWHPSVRGG